MENIEFKQSRLLFEKNHYIIEETGIRLKNKKLSSSSDVLIEFELLGNKTMTEKSRSLIWIIISAFFLLVAILVFGNRMTGGKVGDSAEIFHLFTSLFFYLIYKITTKNNIYLIQSDKSYAIEFLGTKSEEKKVYDFIKILIEKKNEFLIKKYTTFDEIESYDNQYNGLMWLYNKEIITKDELKQKIKELDSLDFQEKVKNNEIIGFRSQGNIEN
jgi:hypothetical protein